VGENTTPWPAEPDLAFIRQDLECRCPGLVFTWTKNSKLVQLGRISADGKFTPKVVTK
jgi:hypothetical protein